MNFSTNRAGAVAALAVLCALVVQPARAAVTWSANLPTAQAAAKQSGSLMMVDFYTDWCGWCKKLDSDVYTDPTVTKASQSYVCLKLNAEKDGLALATKFNVTGYPTILFLDSAGNQFAKIDGYEPADEFTAKLAAIGKEWTDFPVLTAAMKANPNDGASAAKLVLIDADRGALNDAVKLAYVVKTNAPDQLAATCNAIGDGAVDGRQSSSAAAWYNDALAIGKPVDEMVHARVGLFRVAAETKDKVAMKTQLTAILAIPGIPDGLKPQVQQQLTLLNASN